MLFLKFLQAIVKALNSEGTPGQVAAGIAFGAALGLTPLMNLHNLLIVLLVLILNVSMAGFSLGWLVFTPIGFLLDPLFDAIGNALLANESLQGLWESMANAPVIPFTNFNNTVVLGSLLFWVLAWVPIFLLFRYGVRRYRETLFERLKKTRLFQVVKASALYRMYSMLYPG